MDSTLLMVGVTAVFLFVGVFAAAYALAGRTFNLEDRIRLPGSEKAQRNWRETVRKYSMIFKPLGEMLPRSPEVAPCSLKIWSLALWSSPQPAQVMRG